ncbi:MAG: phage portal protein [Anaerolineales bacterium]|nr:phage portal protein [Anaerolineales bacterium]
MNWFTKLFRKAATRLFTFAPSWLRYAFSEISPEKLVKEGYKKNSAVSACATTLQLTFPEPPLLVGYEDEGRFVPDYKHALMKLLQQPNPDMGMAEFLQFAITYNPIGGNCYVHKIRNDGGRVIALYPYSDLNVEPIRGIDTSEGFVRAYEYDPGDGRKTIIPKDDIIHWKWMIDPEFPWKGIGAIALCAKDVDKDSEATSYVYALLKNNAVPPLVVNLEEDDDSTQEEIDAMGAKWIQKHSKGQPAFISAGMKVTQLGYDLNKLAGETLADVPETRIAANFHVPPSVAGLNVGVKRSDYGDTAARKAFTEQTLMALWRSFASEMYNGLKDEFNLPPNYTLKFDVRDVGALQELKKDQRVSVNELWKSGLITRAEAKRELSIKPLPGDDVYYVSLATEFVDAGGNGAVERDSTVSGQRSTVGSQRKGSAVSRQLLSIRNQTAKRMTGAVDAYFSQLADRVIERAKSDSTTKVTKGHEGKSDLPSVDDLMDAGDRKQLADLVKRFYIEVIELSWDLWNVALGVEIAFDLGDPAVTRALKLATKHIQEIDDEIRENLKKALQYASEHGWGIDELVRGDATQPGLRDILVDENYARTVARAELGSAQNAATAERYKDAGVTKVEILDGGAEDSAPACDLANGMIWTLELFERNSLQHPNCSRAAAPYFGDAEAATSWAYPFGTRG